MSGSQILVVVPTVAASAGGLLHIDEGFRSAHAGSPLFIANSALAASTLIATGARFTSTETNDGFGVSINRAVADHDDWEWLIISNDDIEVDKSALAKSIEKLRTSGVPHDLHYLVEEVPRPIPNRMEVFLQCSMLNRVFRSNTRARGRDLYQSFSCVAISRRVWTKLGGFDENLPFTYEDADFVRRALLLGYTTTSLITTGITHEHSVSSGKYIDKVLPVATISALAYLDKWHPGRCKNRATVLSGLAIRTILAPLAKSSNRRHFKGIVSSIGAVFLSQKRGRARPLLPNYWEIQ